MARKPEKHPNISRVHISEQESKINMEEKLIDAVLLVLKVLQHFIGLETIIKRRNPVGCERSIRV